MKKVKLMLAGATISIIGCGTASAHTSIYNMINYNYNYTSITSITTTNIKVNVDSGQSEVVKQNKQDVAKNKKDNKDQQQAINRNEKNISDNTEGVKGNAGKIGTVDQNSRDRDNTLQGNVDQVSKESKAGDQEIRGKLQADMDWSIDQFNKQGQAINRAQAGVESNRRAINGIREDVRNLESGIAGVAALNPVFDPNYDGLQSHVGTAAYGSGTAIGVSLGGRVSENNFIHAGASLPNRGSSVFQAGLTTRW